jgi:hypothetical protein
VADAKAERAIKATLCEVYLSVMGVVFDIKNEKKTLLYRCVLKKQHGYFC